MKTRFPHFMTYSGGLATIFPGTTVITSNFSVLKYEKNLFRTCLLDLTLEGSMHCKQYGALLQKNNNFSDPKIRWSRYM